MDDDRVFRALGDHSRRLLLDRLLERDGRTLRELESQLTMTRFGVMKHLRLLEEAGLVVTRKVGRKKFHYLNPVPIQMIHDRWIGRYTERYVSALADLKSAIEGASKMEVKQAAKPEMVYQVFIKASPERIWEAITTPQFTSRYWYGTHVESSLQVGSPFLSYSSADHSQLLIEGEVLESDPPRRLVYTWHPLWDPEIAAAAPSRLTWEIEPLDGEVCKLTVVHDHFESDSAKPRSVRGGWSWVLSNLKTLLETGEPLPATSGG